MCVGLHGAQLRVRHAVYNSISHQCDLTLDGLQPFSCKYFQRQTHIPSHISFCGLSLACMSHPQHTAPLPPVLFEPLQLLIKVAVLPILACLVCFPLH